MNAKEWLYSRIGKNGVSDLKTRIMRISKEQEIRQAVMKRLGVCNTARQSSDSCNYNTEKYMT